jgi:arylsulfatase A-like enzyme
MIRSILTVLSLGLASQSALADRPNIVMAFADDWGKHASAYARLDPGGINDHVATPNFDAVAAEGVLFTQAFVSAPSCTPCRSSLLSGQHFWMCGRSSILQGAIWDGSNPAYPLSLEKSGYRIGHTYKVWSPGSPADAPHGGAARGFNKHGRRFNQFSQTAMRNPDQEAGKEELLNEVRKNIRSFLDADDDGKLDGVSPFCYWLGPTNCHRKWIAGSGKELWGIDPDDLEGKLPPFLPDVPIVRQDVADYLGEVQAFDAGLGILIEELKRVGAYDNTLLVVSGDHGFPGVTHGKCDLYDFGTQVPLAIRWPEGIPKPGRIVDDFVSLPDLAPTFLESAGVNRPDEMIAKSLVNVLTSEKSGRVDPTRDAVFTGRERHVARARPGNLPYPMRAIRTDQYLYIINFEPGRWPMGNGPPAGEQRAYEALSENTCAAYADLDASPTKAWIVTHQDEDPESFQLAVGRRPKFELYDVKSDPHSMHNLADDPQLADVRSKLQQRLLGELKRTADPRVSDNIVFEKSPLTDPPPTKRKRNGPNQK